MLANETKEIRIKFDKRKLDKLRLTNSGSDKSARDKFFKKIMEQTGTNIQYPSNLFLTKHRKDPSVKITGPREAVNNAKAMILQTLEPHRSKIILKMDVTHMEHPHIIGKSGNLIRKVMQYTSCHIHFPDINITKTNDLEKSNMVSISGEPLNVEKARLLIRALLPIVIYFEVPSTCFAFPILEITTQFIKTIESQYGVTIYFRQNVKSDVTTVYVRCSQSQFPKHKLGICSLLEFCGLRGAESLVNSNIEILPPQQPFVMGMHGCNIKDVMLSTGAMIMFPERDAPDSEKGYAQIRGTIDNVFNAWLNIMHYLPLTILFDVEGCRDITADDEQLLHAQDVCIYSRPISKVHTKTIIVKGSERVSKFLLQFRQQLLGLPPLNFLPDINEINMASSIMSLTSNSAPKPSYVAPPIISYYHEPTAHYNPLLGVNYLTYKPNSTLPDYKTQYSKMDEMAHSLTLFKPSLQELTIAQLYDSGPVGSQSCLPPKYKSCRCGGTSAKKIQIEELTDAYCWGASSSSSSPTYSTSSLSSSPEQNTFLFPSFSDSRPDVSLPKTDYYNKKLLATQAMHRPISAEQVPSSSWAGNGFSRSTPSAIMKQNLKITHDKLGENGIALDFITQEISPFEDTIWSDKEKSIFSHSNCFDFASSYSNIDKEILPQLLRQNGLGQYIDLFNLEEIDYQAFLLLSDQDLENLTVNFGSRKKMISLIRERQKIDWDQRHSEKKTFQVAPGAERKTNV